MPPIRYLLPIALFALILGLSLYGLLAPAHKPPSPMIGRMMPPLAGLSMEGGGKTASSSGWLGRPYLVNVFSSWCAPCKQEHPLLLRFAAERRVALYGVAWRDTQPNIAQYLTQNGNPFQEVIIDDKGQLTVTLGLTGIPETLFVDAKGVVRWKYPGVLTEEVLKDGLMPVMERYAPRP